MNQSQPEKVNTSPQFLVGAGVLGLAALLAWGAVSIPSDAGYAGVGPNFFPWMVSAALAICGVLLLLQAYQGKPPEGVEEPSGSAQGNWHAMAWLSAGVLANAALITHIGFVLSCTLCFVLAVRGMRLSEGRPGGSLKRCLRDVAIGLALSAPVFLLFTKVLAISLPGLTSTGWI